MSHSELTDLIVSLQNEEKASLLTEGNAHVPSMQPPLKKKKKMQSLTTSCSMARETGGSRSTLTDESAFTYGFYSCFLLLFLLKTKFFFLKVWI